MNKHDFVRLMAVNEDLTVDEVTEMTNSVLKGISEALKKEELCILLVSESLTLFSEPHEKVVESKTGEETLISPKERLHLNLVSTK